MRRRTLLGSLAATVGVGLAGCSGEADPAGGAEPSTDASPTETDTATATDTQTPTPTRTVTPTRPDACPTTMDLDVTKPDDLTAGSAASFVVDYEEAYLRKEEVPDAIEDADLRVYSPDVSRLGAGYAVEVTFRYGWCGRRPWGETPTGSEPTETEVCIDAIDETAVYYVDPVVVRRTREHYDEPRKGELLECS